jgi:hypothetical protein
MSPDSAIYQYRIDSAEDLRAWTFKNRYVRELRCSEREQYQVEPRCE